MESGFENEKDTREENQETSSNIPYGSDYNQKNQSQLNSPNGDYHYSYEDNNQKELEQNQQNAVDSYGQNNQKDIYNQNQSGSTYQAPDYGFRQDNYRNNQIQDFHKEYQENQNGQYDNNNNYKKTGSTVKKVFTIAGVAIVIGILAGAAFKGADILIGQTQKNTPLIENQQSADNNQMDSENRIDSANNSENSNVPDSTIGKTSVITNRIGNTVISDIAEEAMASMVSIDCTITETYAYFGRDYSQDETGSGSGFILGENDTELFIATNNHVVEGANSITITFIDETTAEATTKGTDSTADLAVVSVKKSDLKKDTIKQIKIASLGDSTNVRLGEMVVAIGNALGYGQSVTVGYISAKDREVEVTKGEKMILLQTDAAINPGNSGGALINLEGKVVGIPSVKYADSTIEGMGFAIPISRATPILDELMKREILTEQEQGYLGVSCLDVTSDATLYGIPVGVYVSAVSDDGAAKAAGIQVGDIITAINGIETTSREALIEKVHSYRIGTKITLTIQRSHNGKYKEMEVEAELKGASTIEGLPDSKNNSNSGNNDNNDSKNNQDNNNNSGDIFGDSDENYDGNNGMDDFYDFFNEFFN